MNEIPGMKKPELQALPQIKDRLTFLYLEKCQINRRDSALAVLDDEGVVLIPAAAISVLLLGPGAAVTHRAMELAGDAGISILWVGEHGVRYYASGRPLTHRASLLIRQAKMVSDPKQHLAVVRRMYGLRFPGEDLSRLTLPQLRGREGSRVRAAYKRSAEEWGIDWNGREYDHEDFLSGDPVNQALSAANVCLYGLSHAVIAAMGCSPGLGFIHVGHENSFVYDIADLYKAEITIPIAFEMASNPSEDLPSRVRRRVRDVFAEKKLLERMVRDIKWLLLDDEDEKPDGEAVMLWNNQREAVKNGISYGKGRF